MLAGFVDIIQCGLWTTTMIIDGTRCFTSELLVFSFSTLRHEAKSIETLWQMQIMRHEVFIEVKPGSWLSWEWS